MEIKISIAVALTFAPELKQWGLDRALGQWRKCFWLDNLRAHEIRRMCRL